jgi:hypothetical protein
MPTGSESPFRSHRNASRAARWLFLCGAAVFVLFALDMTSRPVVWLLGLVPDDAFYYLQTARHFAHDGRSTFDGSTPTNGYHPGWMALAAILARLSPDGETLLRGAIGLSLALHLAGAAMLVLLLRPVVGRPWAWIGATLWLWNPAPLLLALQAMESSLLVLALVFAVYAGLAWLTPREPVAGPRTGRAALAGLALGLVGWARTDALAFSAWGLAYPLVTLFARRRALRSARGRTWRATILAAAVVAGTLLPWMAFSLASVGTIEQDSAAMKRLWAGLIHEGRSWLECGSTAHDFAHHMVSASVGNLLGAAEPLALSAWFAVPAVLTAALLRGRRRGRRGLRRLLGWLVPPAAGLMLAYGVAITDVQVWYYAAPNVVVFLVVVGSVFILAGRAAPRTQRVLAVGVVTLTAALGLRFWAQPGTLYPWQRDVYRSLSAFEQRMAEGARLGCFNAGIPAYFGRRPVVNLDGLANHAAVTYWWSHRFDAFLVDSGVDYVADEAGVLRRAQRFSGARLPLVPVASLPLTGWPSGPRTLYRVVRDSGPAANAAVD